MFFQVLLFAFCFHASAHQASLNSSGNELFWSNPTVPVVIRSNSNDMTSSQVLSVITNSMNQWNLNSRVKINAVGSSINEIRFQSNWSFGSAVLAVTEINYNSAGAIQKANIMINDNYIYRATPGLYFYPEVFLGDVVTHEIGHLFGLSHSEVLNSSMFYSSFAGQSTLSSDDKAGIRQKYDSGFGSISGHVKGGNSIGVLGVHVQAISHNTGESIGAITNDSGYFRIGGLDLNDTYYIYTSPLKNPESLPDYYSNTQNQFCPGNYVGSFFSACGRENDGKPQGISLTSNRATVNVGTISINCTLRSDSDYDFQKLQQVFSPVSIYDYREDQKYQKAFVGWFRKSVLETWTSSDLLKVDLSNFTNLGGTQKYLRFSLVSYPMGVPLKYKMIVLNNNVPVSPLLEMRRNSVGTWNPDLMTMIPLNSNPNENVFELGISSMPNNDLFWTFPSFQKFASDQHQPYLVMASIWEMSGMDLRPLTDTQLNLSDNSSCLEAPFTYAVAKTNGAQMVIKQSSEDGLVAATGCGTIGPPDAGGPGNSLPAIAAGFLASFSILLSRKALKNFLS